MVEELIVAVAGGFVGYAIRPGGRITPVGYAEAAQAIEATKPEFVKEVYIDTGVERLVAPPVEFMYGGTRLVVDNPGTPTKPVYIRFNEPNFPEFDLTRLEYVEGIFYRFFIRNEAGIGVLRLIVTRGYNLKFLLPNKSSLTTGQKDVTVAGTAEQLPDVGVPSGYKAIILAKPGNTGYIYLGSSKANAESLTDRFDRLEAGDSVPLQITNLNLVWVDASVSGEGISYVVEQ